jgi:hypothetical protein
MVMTDIFDTAYRLKLYEALSILGWICLLLELDQGLTLAISNGPIKGHGLRLALSCRLTTVSSLLSPFHLKMEAGLASKMLCYGIAFCNAQCPKFVTNIFIINFIMPYYHFGIVSFYYSNVNTYLQQDYISHDIWLLRQ